MSDICLGACLDDAKAIFLLPNKPILPAFSETYGVLDEDVSELIALNGNHWRKIFTIMAKLMSPAYDDWKVFRDKLLLQKVGIAFSTDQLADYKGVVFIVGNTFRETLPVTKQALQVGNKQSAFVDMPFVWCPYLDYRQFPNSLIENLRECILERTC